MEYGLPARARFRHGYYLAVVFALSACGGGGGGSNPAPVQRIQPQPVVIDAQGDSTMWGTLVNNGVASQSTNPPTARLQTLLRAQLGPNVTVENHAQPGSTIENALNGVAQYKTPYTPGPEQIVIANWALNDLFQFVDVATYRNSLMQFVTQVRAAGKVVVLEEPNPETTPLDVAPYVQAMDDVAAQMNVPLVKQFDYIKSLPNWQSMLGDGIHPNDDLYAIKAQREADVLAPIVKSLQ